jgi:ribose transport system substrate-binding protein
LSPRVCRTARHRARTAALATLSAPALVAGLAGCAPGTGAEETVTLTMAERDHPYFRQIGQGARSVAANAGIELRVRGARNDPARQAAQLAKAAKRGAEAVLVVPVDPEAAGDAARRLQREDVPVVAIDRAVEGADVASTIASDNLDGGLQAADAVANAVGSEGEVLHLQGDPATSASQARTRGFEDGLAQYGGVQIVAQRPAHFDGARAERLTERLLRRHPDVTAIFAENDEMALGAVRALGERAGTEVHVVGYDGTPAGLRAVEEGRLAGTVAQLPQQLGSAAMEQAIAAIDGAPVSPRVPVGVTLVTRDNVGQFR